MKFPTAISKLLANFVHGDDLHLLAKRSNTTWGNRIFFRTDEQPVELSLVCMETEEPVLEVKTESPFVLYTLYGRFESRETDAFRMASLLRSVFTDPAPMVAKRLTDLDNLPPTFYARLIPLPTELGMVIGTFLGGSFGHQELETKLISDYGIHIPTLQCDFIAPKHQGNKILRIRKMSGLNWVEINVTTGGVFYRHDRYATDEKMWVMDHIMTSLKQVLRDPDKTIRIDTF